MRLMRGEPAHQTVFTRNLHRIMTARGYSPRALSLAAGLSKSYVRDIFVGKIRSAGAEAIRRLADVLQCTENDLMREPAIAQESSRASQERHRANRRRALDVAERAMGEDGDAEHAALIFTTAEMVYGVIVEREVSLGRSISDDDEEFWRLIDSMAQRWIARSR